MSRRARVFIKNAYYHVFSRGQRKELIFIDDGDFNFFLNLLFKTTKQTSIKLFGFCLMPNHYHLLIRSKSGDVSRFMRLINTRYAVYFNSKYKYTGYVFQDRYKAYIILSEEYLFTVLEYINNNPVRKNIVENACEYSFSSANSKFINRLEKFEFENSLDDSIDIKDLIDDRHEYIGNNSEFLSLRKRVDGRRNLDYLRERKGDVRHKEIFDLYKKIRRKIQSKRPRIRRIDLNRQIAQELYKKEFTQREIATLLKIDRSTICRYINFEINAQNAHTVPKKER